jgi:transcription antitermination factor NusG
MSKGDATRGADSYMTHVSDAASFEAFNRHEENPNLSAETLPESSSMIDFKAFAQDYPEKLLPLLERLRPEFQELFAEYWLLGKSQSFIGRVHGFIQTRVWQSLRIIERALGSLIVLGPNPDAEVIRFILRKECVESTPYGSLTDLILAYANSQNYAVVAKSFGAPVPAIRKIFRPAIAHLSASKDLRAAAVGSYLHNLTHQASLTGAGLSKRCMARNRRVKTLRFDAPPSETSSLLSFNRTESLGDTPWEMLEISSEGRMQQIMPTLREQGKKIFGKKPAQIFAPLNAEGELTFGYLFARSVTPAIVRKLQKIRGMGEMSTICDDEGMYLHAVQVPHADILKMIAEHTPSHIMKCRVGQFVRILTGPASGYHGTILKITAKGVQVRVDFPSGRQFLIDADPTSVIQLDVPKIKQTFWGSRP